MSTWEDSGIHAEADRWTYQPFLGSSRRGAWTRSKIVQQIGLRVVALAGLAAGVGMVITSEALTFKPREPDALQRSFQSADMGDVADGMAQLAMASVPVGEQAGSLRSTGFVKTSAAELEDMQALAKLQAAARRAADVQIQPPQAPVVAAIQTASLAIAREPAPGGGEVIGFSPDVEARLPSFEVVAEPALTASIGDVPRGDVPRGDGSEQAAPADASVISDGGSGAIGSETAEEQLAMLPRLPLPRPDPPQTRVRKAKAGGALGSPPNCGTKHAYWRNRGGNKVWYCR